MAKVRFGIVGVGDFGVMHIQTLKQIPEAELVAVSCRTQSRLKALCEKYDIPKWYTDVDELVDDADIDVVIVATGEDTHYSFTEKAIHAGKHVLLEKPICLSVERNFWPWIKVRSFTFCRATFCDTMLLIITRTVSCRMQKSMEKSSRSV